ncbi:hypothetical protein [Ruegeria jejuensis]|uniref:hypothetical protein n=1 Tax=Ruegeria jejuensis TaxID=3233338 RepID=UPI00355AD96C
MTIFNVDPGAVAILKMRCGVDYDGYGFGDAYFRELLSHMGLEADQIDAARFAQEHFNLLFGFLQAKQKEANAATIEDENRALAKVQKAVQKLARELQSLATVGDASVRLYAELENPTGAVFSHKGTTIANALGDPMIDPFRGLNGLLSDLRVGLERAKIQKPKSLEPPRFSGDLKQYEAEKSEYWLQANAQQSEIDNSEERYRERVRQHGQPTNSPLITFVMVFQEIWEDCSDLPFTEGRYEADLADTKYISRTVDAAEHCLIKFGEAYPRSLIVRKIREVREAKVAWAS